MKELYEIMGGFLMVESDINALKATVSLMMSGCKIDENQEMEDILAMLHMVLGCVSQNMRKNIRSLDELLIKKEAEEMEAKKIEAESKEAKKIEAEKYKSKKGGSR